MTKQSRKVERSMDFEGGCERFTEAILKKQK
jgi:hypothetical protein